MRDMPHVLEALIMSFLPVPAPFVHQPHYFQLDNIRPENSSDPPAGIAYGDY